MKESFPEANDNRLEHIVSDIERQDSLRIHTAIEHAKHRVNERAVQVEKEIELSGKYWFKGKKFDYNPESLDSLLIESIAKLMAIEEFLKVETDRMTIEALVYLRDTLQFEAELAVRRAYEANLAANVVANDDDPPPGAA